jgi:hypothetical protein
MAGGTLFGIGLLSIIPAFVGAGLWYDVFNDSWIAAVVWVLLVEGAAFSFIIRHLFGHTLRKPA